MNEPPANFERNPPGFPATRWSLVGRAGGKSDGQPIAIAEIARLYFRALRAHLLQTLDEHRADDILQGFLADKVLEQRLIDHANPQRGRFRTFLLSALDRYVIDMHRSDTAKKRAPRGRVFDVDEQRDTLGGQSASDAFDLAWARDVLDEVLANMRRQCTETNRPELWEVFEVRYLKPVMENIEPEPHESIAQRLKLENAKAAANLLVTARRMFTREFKAVVSRYAADEQEVKDEVTDLWRIISTAKR